MSAKEQLNKIAELLGFSNEESPKEKTELATMKLDDGVVIEAESFESGQDVMVVTDDGRVPLPVGEYTLENGQMLIVEEEGVIMEVREAGGESEEDEELKDDKMEYASKEEMAEVKSAIEELRQAIEAMNPKKEEEMAEEKQEEPKEELSAQSKEEPKKEEPKKEELSEELNHSPEALLEKKLGFRMETRRGRSTQDAIYEKLFS